MAKILHFGGSGRDREIARQAQELVYEAWESRSQVQRRRLARKAIEMDPSCTDAYNILAEESRAVGKRLEYYKMAMEAFTNTHNKKFFNENKGHFWGVMETRPYMRAVAGYGMALWESGSHQEAISQYKGLLELNPNDNQGIRYILVNWLLGDDLGGARKLLEDYDEPSAFMIFNKLLLGIIENNPRAVLERLYQQASDANNYIVPYLLLEKPLPEDLPDSYVMGSPEEAAIYAEDALSLWVKYPGALDILKNLAGSSE